MGWGFPISWPNAPKKLTEAQDRLAKMVEMHGFEPTILSCCHCGPSSRVDLREAGVTEGGVFRWIAVHRHCAKGEGFRLREPGRR